MALSFILMKTAWKHYKAMAYYRETEISMFIQSLNSRQRHLRFWMFPVWLGLPGMDFKKKKTIKK